MLAVEQPQFFETAIGIWQPYIGVFLASLLLTLIATPILRRFAIARGIVDQPDKFLKPHEQPIPYLGGVAIFIGVAVPLLLLAIIGSFKTIPPVIVAIIGSCERSEALFVILPTAALMLIIGLLDDLKNISPMLRITVQVVCALSLVLAGIRFTAIPGLPLGGGVWLRLSPWAFVTVGIIIQIVLVVGASNAMNLLDGLDGLCSGVTVIISLAFLLLATHLVAYHQMYDAPHYESAELIIALSVAMLGAAIGFLPYNFPPASIFMGDAGSIFLGYLFAVLMVLFAEKSGMVRWVLGALIIFGLPILDTALAVVRRLVNRRRIFVGDRSHLYDQLVDRGLSIRQAVFISYSLAIFFGLLGSTVMFLRTRYVLVVAVVVFAAIAAAVWKLGMVRVEGPEKTSGH